MSRHVRTGPRTWHAIVLFITVFGLLLVWMGWDVPRAASLFLLSTWALGTLVLGFLLPERRSSGWGGWAGATATGMATGILTLLLLAAVGIELTSWSVAVSLILELALLALLMGWRPRQLKPSLAEVARRARDLDVSRAQGPTFALAGAVGIAALVAAAAHAIPITTAEDPSTSMAFVPAPKGQADTSDARSPSARTLWVTVDRASADTRAYAVDVTMTGRPAWTAQRIAPAPSPTSVTFPVRFAVPNGCRYQVQVRLTPDGRPAPLYTISAYGGPVTAKPCTGTAARTTAAAHSGTSRNRGSTG